MIQFFMAMEPPATTAQQHRIARRGGKTFVYDSPEMKDAKSKLAAHLARHRPAEPMGGPLRLVVKWCFPCGKHPHGMYKTTKPDTDNLQKMLKDQMTKLGFWKDDALVASEIVEKFWAQDPGIFISVEQIHE